MTKSSSNIYIFYGEDDFSLRKRVSLWKTEFAKKYSPTSIVELTSDNLSEIELGKKFEEVLTPSLFSSKKLIIARNCLPTKAAQTHLIETLGRILKNIPSDYFLVFWQDALDRRLGFVKNLVKEVNLVEFHMPHGYELNSWIKKQAAGLGLAMDDRAIEKLAVLSGRDFFEEKKAGGRVIERKEFFDLWQVYSELTKLATYSNQISDKQVGELVAAKVPDNVFALSDAVVSNDRARAMSVLENLIREENADEKSLAIKLLGLLSEQMRSLLVVSMLAKQNMNQNQIADYLGWSTGRVFITMKHSASINLQKIKNLLQRLMKADLQIKTSDVNPSLLIDLLIVK